MAEKTICNDLSVHLSVKWIFYSMYMSYKALRDSIPILVLSPPHSPISVNRHCGVLLLEVGWQCHNSPYLLVMVWWSTLYLPFRFCIRAVQWISVLGFYTLFLEMLLDALDSGYLKPKMPVARLLSKCLHCLMHSRLARDLSGKLRKRGKKSLRTVVTWGQLPWYHNSALPMADMHGLFPGLYKSLMIFFRPIMGQNYYVSCGRCVTTQLMGEQRTLYGTQRTLHLHHPHYKQPFHVR